MLSDLSGLNLDELNIIMDYWIDGLNVQTKADTSILIKMGFKETALFTLFNEQHHRIYETKLVHLERERHA